MTTEEVKPDEARIYALAAEHGIVAERLPIDAWADKVTELSGNEVVHDPVEDLVVTLRRKGVITAQEATDLYGDYILESSTARKDTQPDKSNVPLRDRVAKSVAMAREVGPFAPGDHKRETNEMWCKED